MDVHFPECERVDFQCTDSNVRMPTCEAQDVIERERPDVTIGCERGTGHAILTRQ